jgi:hypothetical protein
MTSITRLKLAVMTRWPGRSCELATRCAIDKSELYRYEGGRLPMPQHHRAILAAVLGVEPHELDGWVNGEELWFWQKLAS